MLNINLQRKRCFTVRMTRKAKEVVEEPKKNTRKKKTEVEHPEFRLVIEDDYDDLKTKLVVCSNNGSDKKKTLYYARKNRVKRPILLEIDCEETSYKINNFAMSVEEAKLLMQELQRMVDYIEEI